MPKLSKTFLENVDRLMKAGRMSQTELAAKLGVSSPGVSRLLATKDANPKLETIEAIAEALGTPPWELIRPDDTPQATPISQEKRELIRRIMKLDDRTGGALLRMTIATFDGFLALQNRGQVGDEGGEGDEG